MTKARTLKVLTPLLVSSLLLSGCFNDTKEQETAIQKNQLNNTLQEESKKLRKQTEKNQDLISKYEKNSIDVTYLDIATLPFDANATDDFLKDLNTKLLYITADSSESVLSKSYKNLAPYVDSALTYYMKYLDIDKAYAVYGESSLAYTAPHFKATVKTFKKDHQKLKRDIKKLENELTTNLTQLSSANYQKELQKETLEQARLDAKVNLTKYTKELESKYQKQYEKEMASYDSQLAAYESVLENRKDGDPTPTAPKKPEKKKVASIASFTDEELDNYLSKAISEEDVEMDRVQLELYKSTRFLLGCELLEVLKVLQSDSFDLFDYIQTESTFTYTANDVRIAYDTSDTREHATARYYYLLELYRNNKLANDTTKADYILKALEQYSPEHTYQKYLQKANSFLKKDLYTKNRKQRNENYYTILNTRYDIQNQITLLKRYLSDDNSQRMIEYRISQLGNLLAYYEYLLDAYTVPSNGEPLKVENKYNVQNSKDIKTIRDNIEIVTHVYDENYSAFTKKHQKSKENIGDKEVDLKYSKALYNVLEKAVNEPPTPKKTAENVQNDENVSKTTKTNKDE